MKKLFLFFALSASMAVMATEGALPGRFTINAQGDQIVFSKGNLLYDYFKGVWSLAEHQYDVLDRFQNGELIEYYNGRYGSTEKTDIFGWGTGCNPILISVNDSDYNMCPVPDPVEEESITYDWGSNPISNGGNRSNLWRTLTKEEWEYMIFQREHGILWGMGSVNGINGLFLLPDGWNYDNRVKTIREHFVSPKIFEQNSDTYYAGYHYNASEDYYVDNTFTAEQWTALENDGVVFLPVTGCRDGNTVYDAAVGGEYWSTTTVGEKIGFSSIDTYDAKRAYFLGFVSTTSSQFMWLGFRKQYSEKHWGYAVRLVQKPTKESTHTDIENINQTQERTYKKLLQNGQLFILRGDKTYTVTGQELK